MSVLFEKKKKIKQCYLNTVIGVYLDCSKHQNKEPVSRW